MTVISPARWLAKGSMNPRYLPIFCFIDAETNMKWSPCQSKHILHLRNKKWIHFLSDIIRNVEYNTHIISIFCKLRCKQNWFINQNFSAKATPHVQPLNDADLGKLGSTQFCAHFHNACLIKSCYITEISFCIDYLHYNTRICISHIPPQEMWTEQVTTSRTYVCHKHIFLSWSNTIRTFLLASFNWLSIAMHNGIKHVSVLGQICVV